MANPFDENIALTRQYHGQFSLHRFGEALGAPEVPTTITPLATQTAATGTSEAPARADHTHGIASLYTTALTSYTPTLTQTGGVAINLNVTNYLKIDKLVMVWFDFRANAAGTAGALITVSLPVNCDNSGPRNLGSGRIYDVSAGLTYAGAWEKDSASTIKLLYDGGANYAGLTGVAGGLAVGDVITGQLLYYAP